MSWDIFSKSKIQYFLQKLKDKFVQKETGKGLSTNDFDNTYKSKVDKIDGSLTSVSGNPISISGLKSNQLAANPIITLEPIQAGSGTPSPVNQRPISGYDKVEALSCGVNVWNEHWELGYYNPSTGEPVSSSSNIRTPINEPIIVFGNATYYWKQSYNGRVLFYDSANNFITSTVIATGGNTTFTTPSNAKYMRFQISSDYGTVYKNDLSINYPATQTSYVPYHKTTDLSESLGQTVYGGTLDVRTGKLVVDRQLIDLGSLTWYRYSTTSIFHSTPTGQKVVSSVVCDSYNGVMTKIIDLGNYEVSANAEGFSTGNKIAIRNDNYTDANTFAATLVGKYAVTELETPFTIQLTPHEISLLKDYAYVSTNGTNIALDYHNGELASLADVSQLGETVNKGLDYLKDYVEANKYGSPVNLVSYTSVSNVYTFPADGYLTADSKTISSGYARVVVRDSTNGANIAFIYMNITGQYQIQSVFVRKGMKAYILHKSADAIDVYYIPLQ